MNLKPRDMDVCEILDELVKIKSEENAVEWLQTKYGDHQPLQYILKMNYCSTIVSMLPEGEPPFNKEPIDGPSRSSLWNYLKMFPAFVRSAQSMKMKASQIEKIFIEMLDSIDPREAEMVCLAKDRQLESKWDIDLNVVKAAFPNLIASEAQRTVVPVSPEEKAENLITTAKDLRARAKQLIDEAKEYEKEAKTLASGDKNASAA